MARILVIDDSTHVRVLLRTALQLAGHQVIEASNGEEGLRAFRQQPADLVLCDLFMPVRDGLETIRDLHNDFPGVKVVAMSGGAFQGRVNMLPAAGHLGAIAVLDKPFRLDALRAVVEQALDKASSDPVLTADVVYSHV
jgi:DNA-binding NtrC family response regulator